MGEQGCVGVLWCDYEVFPVEAPDLDVALAVAGPALASQCHLLIKQVMDATAGKTDDASKKAAALANEAKALHDAEGCDLVFSAALMPDEYAPR